MIRVYVIEREKKKISFAFPSMYTTAVRVAGQGFKRTRVVNEWKQRVTPVSHPFGCNGNSRIFPSMYLRSFAR